MNLRLSFIPRQLKRRALVLGLCVLSGPVFLWAQEAIDENTLFSNSDILVEAPKENRGEDAQKNYSVGLSGRAELINQISHNRAAHMFGKTYTDSTIVTNLYLDVRYLTYYKLFVNAEFTSTHPWDSDDETATSNDIDSLFPEFFVDTPIKNTVYLRTGKQVLRWGRCRLWNPTDVINIDKETFIDRTTAREGVYGIKIHVPRGTQYNWYAFIDTGKKWDKDTTGGALKFEFLTGNTEMAFSIWDKNHFKPVLGYDVSTRVLGLDVVSEISASKGFLHNTLNQTGNILSIGNREEWETRASLDVGRDFNFRDEPDKVNITGSVFYNGPGHTKNVFSDGNTYVYAQPITLDNGTVVPGGDKATFFLANHLYETNYHGRYYAALFTSVNKFFNSNFTLSNNIIRNISDGSSIFSTGLHYENINNWEADLNAYVFDGHKDREYTFAGTRALFQLSATYRF